jgi:hypothetical protein
MAGVCAEWDVYNIVALKYDDYIDQKYGRKSPEIFLGSFLMSPNVLKSARQRSTGVSK